MESTSIIERKATFIPSEKVRANNLIAAFDYFAPKTTILSLDCFDTLLWRKTALPTDVFYNLQHKPTFQALNFNTFLRIRLESFARGVKAIQEKISEVTLEEIYRAGFPHLTSKELDALIKEELEAETEACYGFPPVVNLIRHAHAQGVKIIIVSNTYLTEPQLRRLLADTLPHDVMPLISEIFCSSEYGVSKNNGLFKHILNKINYRPDSILHIGDNYHADCYEPRMLGINSLHFIQYDTHIDEHLRMHAASASVFSPAIRYTKPLNAPFRGLFASTEIDKPETALGYVSIGPIMYTFAEFICDEVNQLKQAGKKPKVLFLMRDAHLPHLACEALAGEKIGHRVHISRFSVYASSFRTKEDISKYLLNVAFTCRFREIAKQLLLPPEVIEPLVEIANQSSNPPGEFINQILREQMMNIIFKKSELYRKRLIKYLKKETNIKRGDTLVFVDLGYSGTAQQILTPILEDECGVEVTGRYLIQLSIPDWEKTRRGLLDPSWCDERAMLALVNYIALLEQVSTSNEKSVVDYDEDGNIISSDSGLDNFQYEKLQRIQQECLQFIKDAKQFFNETGKISLTILREYILSELARMIFLPTEKEIQYLESFQFDLNLGTKDIFQMFDANKGLSSLRKRGTFFHFMEKNMKTMRTNVPAELRTANLELVMTLMTQSRFAIELGYKDMSLRREKIKIAYTENNNTATTEIDSLLTYDGFYSLTIPFNPTFSNLAILFGQRYQWVEIHSAEQIEMNAYLNLRESLQAEDYMPYLAFHDMSNKGGLLYECLSASSFVMIQPSSLGLQNKSHLLRIVFRPIVYREEASGIA